MAFVTSSFIGALPLEKPTASRSTPLSQSTPVSMSQSTRPSISRRAALAALSASTASVLLGGGAALADHTYVAARRAFDRYYPRILAGVDQVREVRGLVRGSGAGSVAEIVDGKVFDVKLRRALRIYATSFSDNYLGERSRDLLKCVDTFYAEMGKVKVASETVDGVEHYNRAINALVNYFSVARLDKAVLKDLYI